jgi:hypothetical protein
MPAFISYSRGDLAFAESIGALAAALTAAAEWWSPEPAPGAI